MPAKKRGGPCFATAHDQSNLFNFPESRSQSMDNFDLNPRILAATDEELTDLVGKLARDGVIPSQFHDVLLAPNMGRRDYNSPILPTSGTQQHDTPDVTTPGLTHPRFGRFCGAWLAFVATYTGICALLVAYTAWKFQSETYSAFQTHLGFIIMSLAAFVTTLVTSGIIAYSNNDLQSLMMEHFYPVYDVILKIVFCFSAVLTPLSYLLLLFISEKFNWAGYLIVWALFVAIVSFKFRSLKRALAAKHTNHLGAFQMV